MIKRKLIVGDIHGCYDELLELIEKSGISNDDEIIAIGDLIDRGPKSVEVVKFFINNKNATSIRGNHERKILNLYDMLKKNNIKDIVYDNIYNNQILTMLKSGDFFEEMVKYFKSLPLYLELDEAILVHAYIDKSLPLEKQKEVVLLGVMTVQKRFFKKYGEDWYKHYNKEKPLIVGHKSYKNGEVFVYKDKFYGIDTHCYGGKALSGLILPEFKIVSVKSKKIYYLEKESNRENIPSSKMKELVKKAERGKKIVKQFKLKLKPKEDFTFMEIEELREEIRKNQIDSQELINKIEMLSIAYDNAIEKMKKFIEKIEKMHSEIIANMKKDGKIKNLKEWNSLNSKEQGRVYQEYIKGNKLSKYLHLARSKSLTLEKLKSIIHSPYNIGIIEDNKNEE